MQRGVSGLNIEPGGIPKVITQSLGTAARLMSYRLPIDLVSSQVLAGSYDYVLY